MEPRPAKSGVAPGLPRFVKYGKILFGVIRRSLARRNPAVAEHESISANADNRVRERALAQKSFDCLSAHPRLFLQRLLRVERIVRWLIHENPAVMHHRIFDNWRPQRDMFANSATRS